MIATDSDKKWFDEFILELRLRDVLGSAIGDAVASARELLDDSGQSAEEAFGPARAYAESLELPRETGPGVATRGLWPALVGLLSLLPFVQAATVGMRNELLLVSPAQLALLAVPLILAAFLPVYLNVIVRRPWLFGLIIFVGAVTGFLSSLFTPDTQADDWLTLDPLPVAVGSAIVMVLSSVWSSMRVLQRGNIDEIIEPLAVQSARTKHPGRAFALLTAWLFPLAALLLTVPLFLLTR